MTHNHVYFIEASPSRFMRYGQSARFILQKCPIYMKKGQVLGGKRAGFDRLMKVGRQSAKSGL